MTKQLHSGNNINSDTLRELMMRTCTKYHVPGMAIVLFDDKSILQHEVAGVKNLESGQPISKEDYFHIGSTGKSILAVIAAKTVERNKIKWDTKFLDLFPELKSSSLPDYYDITLENLFRSEAGVKPFTTGLEKYPQLDPDDPRIAFVKWLLQQSPSSKKSANGFFEYNYSNAGYCMIALMLEKVNACSYSLLLDEVIVNYLNSGYFFGLPAHSNPDHTWGHGDFFIDEQGNEHYLNKGQLHAYSPQNDYKLNELIRPAGDISMKPLDFARYTQLHLKGLRGIDNFISADSFKFLDLSGRSRGLGVSHGKFYGKQIAGFDGSMGIFYCRGLVIPEDNVGFTILINCGSQRAVNYLSLKIVKTYFNWWWKFWI